MFVLLGLVYAAYSYQFTNEINDTVSAEYDALKRSYVEGGRQQTKQFIASRSNQPLFSDFYYLLQDVDGQPLAGNLVAWPESTQYTDDWLGFEQRLLISDSSQSVIDCLWNAAMLAGVKIVIF